MEESKSELLEKLVLKNNLNEETISNLIKIILKFTHSICSNKDNYIEPLEIMSVEFKILEDHYREVVDSIGE